ncbi:MULTISPECIES: thiamine pyrophosphate-dependent enzyme [unclassified Candidatus Frackibacter]|uniref:thiamine pyrophosphate-dependent enzyme n=1 Tax=unclassified Candidatus Frackibacter TaxID=2648818 RepID=UPI0008863598|nr:MULTISPECIES: thiamine pyrophosphate-dependent enzyme [unclassified Candidatus Frackibacter]SDC54192.1 pyruvate ferredoxin oxidoreductase beta subunit [Candidatus Frackibacter sp. WG11]SEM66410.1 pyruvate ferredoxin oxidoreductase beta subunit [Candidatus Frackibacter sp. WG12]SFL77777.1 pyruvate ferredoxin oxidoreductase beta subunit [Candidatus Frackibacter sp. WG13]
MSKVNLKELSLQDERLTGGHRLCSGCGASIIVRQILHATDDPVVVGCATGCLEVSTTIYPYTAWKDSFIHNAFENAAATISGTEAAYRSLKRQGKIDEDKEVKFIAFGGDGGTYDIGFQSLSGAMERGHNMVYVCYDNGAYMNTGIQRSSATPRNASTTTSPAGEVIPGKTQFRKELTDIIAAHNIPYVAQASPHNFKDLIRKARKAFEVDGPAFLNVLSQCPRGWRYPEDQAMDIMRAGTDSCFWPLFEVEDGEWKLNHIPKEKAPVTDWLEPQGRFKHLFKEGNEDLIEEIQEQIDKRWEELLHKCGEK